MYILTLLILYYYLYNIVFLYYHFSQGQFKKAYNLEVNTLGTDDPDKILKSIGIKNRKKYFDF